MSYRSNKGAKAAKPKAKRVKDIPRTLSLFNPRQQGLPTKLKLKLRYPYLSIYSAGVTQSVQQFRLNSIFDPDYTNTGNQPPFRDQLAQWFYNYRVTGCKWRVETSFLSGTLCGCVVSVNTSGTAPNDWASAAAMPGSQSGIVGANIPLKMKGYVDMATAFGVDKAEVLTDPAYSALFSANPTNVAYLNITHNQCSGTTTSTGPLLVDLTYYVECFNPVMQSMN